MDLDLSPCACGLLGPVPKSIVEGPNFSRSSLVEGPMVGERLKACDPKGKAPMGYDGSRPKFAFKPKLWVLGQLEGLCKGQVSHPKKDLGLGPRRLHVRGSVCTQRRIRVLVLRRTYTPGGSIPSNTFVGPIVELQPRLEVEGRTNAGGSGLGVAAMTTSEL